MSRTLKHICRTCELARWVRRSWGAVDRSKPGTCVFRATAYLNEIRREELPIAIDSLTVRWLPIQYDFDMECPAWTQRGGAR